VISLEDLSLVRALVLSDRRVARFQGAEHHDFIASAIINSNEPAKAAELYRQSLAIKPDNGLARRGLQLIEKSRSQGAAPP
jgi:hypothetical protein